jgi:site-specific recombinase XerD
MNASTSRKSNQDETWPRKVQPGREVVNVYRRKTPSGNFAFMVANYADGKRRFDAYSSEADALTAADKLARLIDKRAYKAASITEEQAIEYATAALALAPFNITVGAGVGALVEWLKSLGDGLPSIHAAVSFYKARHKLVTKQPVAVVVAELLKVKGSRGASVRYAADLRLRLERFAGDCNKDCCNVTTADLQAWLDALGLAPQSYRNYRTVLHTLFEFAVARGYAADNPVAGVEKLKVRNGDIEIFKPVEIARLLESARANYPDFLPSLAIGAFAGLRSAEIERLEWKDIDFASRHIVVSASNAKTASRRIVPLCDNLAAWLAPYSGRQQGKVWPGEPFQLYKRQQQVALATAVEADESKGVKAQKPLEWKGNALRHSYASYRFALTGDAGRVAGECGNSAAVIHRHYRELVKPADAERWFQVKPEAPANVLPMPAAVATT